MSDRSKVIWSEGLFLRPQHFQQQERYFEWYVETRAPSIGRHDWGFEELELDRDVLAIGKIAIRRARGVFPDGTPFSIPDHDPSPPHVEIAPEVRGKRAYLALPLRRAGALESERGAASQSLARQGIRELDLRDVTVESASTALLEVGGLRTRILIEDGPMEDFAYIPLAHVQECRPGKQVVLDERFMPTVLRVKSCAPLDEFLTELYGLLHQRGDMLAGVVTNNAQGGLAGMREFMRLQAVNRHEPLVRHFMQSTTVHPEELFRQLLLVAGEFAGLAREVQRPAAFPPYDHGNLRASFEPLIAAVRGYLIDVDRGAVQPINVELRQTNAYLARIDDSSLIDSAVFVLAVKASMPQEEIRRRIPQMVTIAPSVRLKELVELQTPGLELAPLVQVPPVIPFFAGFVYFEINRSNRLWKDMKGSGAFGLFVAESLPNLSFLMWAIRGG